MSRRLRNVGVLILLPLFLLLCGCANRGETKNSNDEARIIQTRFKRIFFELRNERGDGDHLPVSFTEIESTGIDRRCFVCPNSESNIGSMKSIAQWTDFIYFGNCKEYLPDAALIVSPPENHHGEYGYLLNQGGIFFKLPAAQLRRVVAEPWLLATNAPMNNIEDFKKGFREEIVIQMPNRLKNLYRKTMSRFD